jgi:hypothetical protein
MANHDGRVRALLGHLGTTRRLKCGETVLAFQWELLSEVIGICEVRSSGREVKIDADRLCDHVNGLNQPYSDELLLSILCDVFTRPRDYGAVET